MFVGPISSINSLVCQAELGLNTDFVLSSELYIESEKKFTHLSSGKVNSFYEHLWVEFCADINFKSLRESQGMQPLDCILRICLIP